MLGTALRAIYIAIKLNDSDFYRKLSQVNQATDEAVKKIKQMNQSLEELGKYMAGVGAVGQAGIGLAVKQFADFEQAFVNLKKVMPKDRDFERIQKSAENMAKYYGRSVEDILGVMELWARQGKNTEDQLEKLTNATLLWATAENLDAREATEYLTYILNGFKLEAKDATHVVDALNEVSNNFATDSVKLARTLQDAAGVAHQYGVSLEQLIGYATALHSAGYEAGEAGTFLAYMFSKLYEDNVAELLQQVGIAVKDSSGHFRSASDILDDLAKKWNKLNDEQRHAIANEITIGGRVSMLYGLFNNWGMAVDATNTALNSQGSAAREASRALKTLSVELKKTWESIKMVGVYIGKSVAPLVIPALKVIQGLADAFTRLPEPVQKVLGLGLAFSTMLMLVGGGAILLRAKLIELIGHLVTLGLVETTTTVETLSLGGALKLLAVQGFKSSIGAIIGFARAVMTAQVSLMGLSIPLLPLIAGIGAVITAILLLQDIMVKGWEKSYLGRFVNWLIDRFPILKALTTVLSKEIKYLREGFDWLAKSIGGAISWIQQALDRFSPLRYVLLSPVGSIVYLITHIDKLRTATSSALTAIKSLWDRTIGGIIAKIDEFLAKVREAWDFIAKSPVGKIAGFMASGTKSIMEFFTRKTTEEKTIHLVETKKKEELLRRNITEEEIRKKAIEQYEYIKSLKIQGITNKDEIKRRLEAEFGEIIVNPQIIPYVGKPEYDKKFYEEGSIKLKIQKPVFKPEIEKPALPKLSVPELTIKPKVEMSWIEQLYAKVQDLLGSIKLPKPDLVARVRYLSEKLTLPTISPLSVPIRFLMDALPKMPKISDLIAKIKFIVSKLPELPKLPDLTARIGYVVDRLPRLPELPDLVSIPKIPELMSVIKYTPDVVKPEIKPLTASLTYIPKLVKPEITHELTKMMPTPSQLISSTQTVIHQPTNYQIKHEHKTIQVPKIEIKIEGVKDPDKVAELVEKRIQRQFNAIGIY